MADSNSVTAGLATLGPSGWDVDVDFGEVLPISIPANTHEFAAELQALIDTSAVVPGKVYTTSARQVYVGLSTTEVGRLLVDDRRHLAGLTWADRGDYGGVFSGGYATYNGASLNLSGCFIVSKEAVFLGVDGDTTTNFNLEKTVVFLGDQSCAITNPYVTGFGWGAKMSDNQAYFGCGIIDTPFSFVASLGGGSGNHNPGFENTNRKLTSTARAVTTNATPAQLFADIAGTLKIALLAINTNTQMHGELTVTGQVEVAGELTGDVLYRSWRIFVARNEPTGVTALAKATALTSFDFTSAALAACSVAAPTVSAGGEVSIVATGKAATTIHWTAVFDGFAIGRAD